MKLDDSLQRDVQAELRWVPALDDTDIAVKVTDGVVTLTGFVPDFHQKYRAEAAVKRLAGVTAVANDLAVRLPLGRTRTDPEIARDVVAELKGALPASWQNIKALVHEGRVSLDGVLEWHFERERAEKVARRTAGVVSVRNSIALKPHSPSVTASEIRRGIEEAFRRNAIIDARLVNVDTVGSEVTLRGEVRSWAEHDQAQQAAWSAPGVMNVKNELRIRT